MARCSRDYRGAATLAALESSGNRSVGRRLALAGAPATVGPQYTSTTYRGAPRTRTRTPGPASLLVSYTASGISHSLPSPSTTAMLDDEKKNRRSRAASGRKTLASKLILVALSAQPAGAAQPSGGRRPRPHQCARRRRRRAAAATALLPVAAAEWT